MASRRPVRQLRHRNGIVIAVVFLALMVAWGMGLRSFADSIPHAPVEDAEHTDAIVVLTGGSGRLDEGLGLLLADRADMLFISGVYDGIEVRYLLQTFIKGGSRIEHRVEIGNATNTVGNAEETAEWMAAKGYSSLRLVTAAYHMPRSLLEFGFVLHDIRILPNPVFPEHVKPDWWRWPGTAWLVIKEYNKYLLAWVRHRAVMLRGVFPADG